MSREDVCTKCEKKMSPNRWGVCMSCRSTACKRCKKSFRAEMGRKDLCSNCATMRRMKEKHWCGGLDGQ